MSTPGFSAPTVLDTAAPAPSLTAPSDTDLLREPVDPNVFVNPYTRPLPDVYSTFKDAGYHSPPMKASAAATAAIVCGAVGLILVVPLIAAVIFGHLGLANTRDNRLGGRPKAMCGLMLGYIGLAAYGAITFAVAISMQL